MIETKYLAEKDYVHIKNILDSFYRTPGEIRLVSEEAFKRAIKDGVEKGLFGFGVLKDHKPVCKAFMEVCSPSLTEEEIIIRKELCATPEQKEQTVKPTGEKVVEASINQSETAYEVEEETVERSERFAEKKFSNVEFVVELSEGSIHELAKVVRDLSYKFNRVSVKVTISATDGEISKSECENKILETLYQIGNVLEKSFIE